MSQIVVSETVSDDGVWQTTFYGDGSTSVVAAPGTAMAVAQDNARTLQQRAVQALTVNATYLGIAIPTAAQTTAQVKALTRQVNAIIRLLVVADTSTISDS